MEAVEKHVGAHQKPSTRNNGWFPDESNEVKPVKPVKPKKPTHTQKVHPEVVPCGEQANKSTRLKVLLAMMVLMVLILLAVCVIFIILYVEDRQNKNKATSDLGMSVCWKPLVESSKVRV